MLYFVFLNSDTHSRSIWHLHLTTQVYFDSFPCLWMYCHFWITSCIHIALKTRYTDWHELENIEGYNTTKCCIPLSWSCSVFKGTHKFKSTRNCSESKKVKYVQKLFAKSGLEFSAVRSIHSAARRTVTPEAITLSLHPTECSYSRWFTVLLKYIVLILS